MSLTKVSYAMVTGAPVNVLDFGAVGDGVANDTIAIQAAIDSISDDGVLVVPPGTYKITSTLTLGQSGKGARLVGIGKPTIKFYGLSASTDCVVLNGAAMRQIELRNIIVDCNTTGRDGVVLQASDTPFITNVVIKNSVRDGFAIYCSTNQFVENGTFQVITQTSGRHGVRMEVAGSTGAFINECIWIQLEIRGVSAITPGANAIRMQSSASGSGSKISNHYFAKTNFDAQYVSPNSQPSLNIIEIASGTAENFTFSSGGWENTGATPLTGGYAWAVSGTGVWTGLTVDSVIWNSYWGNLGPQSTINQQFIYDFSFSKIFYNVPMYLSQLNAASEVFVGSNTASLPKVAINSNSGTAEGGTLLLQTLGVSKSVVGKKSAVEGSGTDDSLSIQSYSDNVYVTAVGAAKNIYLRNGTTNIGTVSSGGLAVNGSLSKTSGSFKINHPLRDLNSTHYLVHSFIEGPQADNLYRGQVKLVNGSASVNLDEAAKMTEGTFLALNTNLQCFTTNETNWDAVKGSITGNVLTIQSQNAESNAAVSWLVIGERHDADIVKADWTDNNGKVIVEPQKQM